MKDLQGNHRYLKLSLIELFYLYDKDLEISFRYKEVGRENIRMTKWYNVELFNNYEVPKCLWYTDKQIEIHRRILQNEIVIDLDNDNLKENLKVLNQILEKLKDKFDYYIFYSGNKGFHIHLFFINKLKKEEKEEFFNTYLKEFKGVDYQNFITEKKLIRLEGSIHLKTGFYKTYLGKNLIHLDLNDVIFIKGINKHYINLLYKYLKDLKTGRNEFISKYLYLTKPSLTKTSKIKKKNFNKIKIKDKIKEIFNKKVLDGCQRLLFLFVCELRPIYNMNQSYNILLDWYKTKCHKNTKVNEEKIKYVLNEVYNKGYKPFTLEKINEILEGIQFEEEEKNEQ